jgi:CTP:molybdopterin cytidylyltransferase MocA
MIAVGELDSNFLLQSSKIIKKIMDVANHGKPYAISHPIHQGICGHPVALQSWMIWT